MPENTELKDYGRLLKDGELRIKAHDDHKIKVRYVCVLMNSYFVADLGLKNVVFCI